MHLNVLTALIFVHLFASSAYADTSQSEAEEICTTQLIADGAEVALNPITITGEPWRIIWENERADELPGDTLEIQFEKAPLEISGTTLTMADHIITILNHRARGVEPIAALWPNGDVTMTITLKAGLIDETKPDCLPIWLLR